MLVTLNKFRRRQATADPLVFLPGDFQHLTQVVALSLKDDECEDAILPAAIRTARRSYPYKGEAIDTTLCLTNKRRLMINEIENGRLAPVGAIPCVYKGSDPRAQSMLLWPGLKISAGQTNRKHGLKNALSWVVESVNIDWCTLARGETRLTIPTVEVAGLFRLAHALTIDSSQTLTLQGRVLLVESDHKHFSLRRLIVALGRVPRADMIHVQ